MKKIRITITMLIIAMIGTIIPAHAYVKEELDSLFLILPDHSQIGTSPSNPWTITDGVASNPKIGGNQSSFLKVFFTVPEGKTYRVCFDWKASSENNCDYLSIFKDDEKPERNTSGTKISGYTDYSTVNLTFEEGDHSLTWYYAKDGSVDSGDDCGYVKNISIGEAIALNLYLGNQGDEFDGTKMDDVYAYVNTTFAPSDLLPKSYDNKYVIDGWYSDAELTSLVESISVLEESITLYAKYRVPNLYDAVEYKSRDLITLADATDFAQTSTNPWTYSVSDEAIVGKSSQTYKQTALRGSINVPDGKMYKLSFDYKCYDISDRAYFTKNKEQGYYSSIWHSEDTITGQRDYKNVSTYLATGNNNVVWTYYGGSNVTQSYAGTYIKNIKIEIFDTVDSGTAGTCIWSLSEGVLNVSGSIPNFTPENPAPWDAYADDITFINDNGLIGIGDYAFYNLENVTNDVEIDGVKITSVGTHAFNNNIRVFNKHTTPVDSGKVYVTVSTSNTSITYENPNVPYKNGAFHLAGEKMTINPTKDLYYTFKYTITGQEAVVPENGGSYETVVPNYSISSLYAYYDTPQYSNSTYQIANKYQLSYAAYNYQNSSYKWAILADIDLSQYENFQGYGNTVYANIDGKGHTINLNINSEIENSALFKYSGNGFNLHDLNITGTITTTGKYAGGIIGAAYGTTTIERCSSSVDIKFTSGGDATTGGFAGIIKSTTLNATDSYYTGKIYSDDAQKPIEGVGGLCGWSEGTVNLTNCFSVGTYENVTGGENLCRGAAPNLVNCYYLNTVGESTQGTQKTAEEFADGTVAALLGETFMDGEKHPVLASGSVKLTCAYLSGTCIVIMKNTTKDAVSGVEYIATYNSAGALTSVTKKEVSVPNATNYIDTIELTKADDDSLRAFFWNGGITPISNLGELK